MWKADCAKVLLKYWIIMQFAAVAAGEKLAILQVFCIISEIIDN